MVWEGARKLVEGERSACAVEKLKLKGRGWGVEVAERT